MDFDYVLVKHLKMSDLIIFDMGLTATHEIMMAELPKSGYLLTEFISEPPELFEKEKSCSHGFSVELLDRLSSYL